SKNHFSTLPAVSPRHRCSTRGSRCFWLMYKVALVDGLLWESNPGLLRPKRRIIPLDQVAETDDRLMVDPRNGYWIPRVAQLFLHSACDALERQLARVVKGVDSKSTGLCPHWFKNRSHRVGVDYPRPLSGRSTVCMQNGVGCRFHQVGIPLCVLHF